MTKPSRVASNGREACSGSSLRVESAPIELNPATPSTDPATDESMLSASRRCQPYRVIPDLLCAVTINGSHRAAEQIDAGVGGVAPLYVSVPLKQGMADVGDEDFATVTRVHEIVEKHLAALGGRDADDSR